MAGNIDPIYGKVYKNPRLTLTAGSATYDGSAATLLFTADATNGSRLTRVVLGARGTNVQTTLRLYTAIAGASFAFFKEIFLPATTAGTGSAMLPLDFDIDLGLGAAVQIYAHLSVAVASGYDVMLEAMDY